MLSPVVRPPGLVTGERLTVEEFLRRWEDLPDLKNAELIDGVVYVPSPVSLDHGRLDSRIILWLAYYAQATPGCDNGNNSTWLMSGSAPQPDAYLQILPSHGGQSGIDGPLGAGAPELAVEICVTSTEVDVGPKLALSEGRRAGIHHRRTLWTTHDLASSRKRRLCSPNAPSGRHCPIPGLSRVVARCGGFLGQ
jgi:Uma2 family endonuclease